MKPTIAPSVGNFFQHTNFWTSKNSKIRFSASYGSNRANYLGFFNSTGWDLSYPIELLLAQAGLLLLLTYAIFMEYILKIWQLQRVFLKSTFILGRNRPHIQNRRGRIDRFMPKKYRISTFSKILQIRAQSGSAALCHV